MDRVIRVFAIVGVLIVGVFSLFGCTSDAGGSEPSVDAASSVSVPETVLVESFELREYGMMAGYQVYSAEPGDAGMMLVSSYWLDNNDTRSDVREALVSPSEVAQVFEDCHVVAWDGFSETDSRVLDGYGFSFTATLSDGTVVSAHGSNAFPEGYRDFENAVRSMLGE